MLQQLAAGNQDKVNELMPLVYQELHDRAQRQLYGERAEHTINPTALVHEAYLKLVQQEDLTN